MGDSSSGMGSARFSGYDRREVSQGGMFPTLREVSSLMIEDQVRRKMSRAEAGRKGGLTTKNRYGEEHFGRIGRIGGKKGGETTKQRYGTEFYQKIGRI